MSNSNVPVALVFFARPDVLVKSFSAIRAAKPKQLFLIQDGSRKNREDDLVKIAQCREIVSNIDWDCEVRTNYTDKNMGCGMRVYSGISWAFQYVERLIIIEDDCVPSISFFDFCEEILEKYKNDQRINMISGMNHIGNYQNTPCDYFFSDSGAISGWATWKRVWQSVDFNLGWILDSETERLINNLHGPFLYRKGRHTLSALNKGQNISSWSYQMGMNLFLNSRLNIIPKYNLTTNIGLTENSANSVNSLKLIPRGLRRMYFMKSYEIKFPLIHPKYVANDIKYKKMVDKIMGRSNCLVKFSRQFESILLRIWYGEFSSIYHGIKRRLS